MLHDNIFLQNLKLFTKSPNTILATIYKKPKYYFGNYLQKAQILFWHLLSKNPKLLGKQLFYLNPNIICKRIILCSKPKTIFWQKHFLIVRDRENCLSKREIFGVLFRAPLFLGKWCGVATYFFIKKEKRKKKKEKINTWLNCSLHWLNK